MRKQKWAIGIAVFLGIGFMFPGLTGQDNQYSMIYLVEGQPDKELELHAAIKEHAEWREAEGDPWSWTVFQEIVGEGLGNYHIASWGHNLSCIDEYQDFLAKGHVEWAKNVMPLVSKETNVVLEQDYSISHWPKGTPNDYILVIHHEIVPGQVWKYKESVKTIHETILANEHPVAYSFSRVFAGTPANIMTLAIPGDSMDSLKDPQKTVYELMVRVHGEETANAVYAEMFSVIRNMDSFVVKKLPDLGVTAAE